MKVNTTAFARDNGMEDYVHYFQRGGLLNLDSNAYEPPYDDGVVFSDSEIGALKLESSESRFNQFRQSSGLWTLVMLCSAAAAGESHASRTCSIG